VDGTVSALSVSVGDQVEAGAPLAAIEESDPADVPA
jgi:biotin carboxyl carrier protein